MVVAGGHGEQGTGYVRQIKCFGAVIVSQGKWAGQKSSRGFFAKD